MNQEIIKRAGEVIASKANYIGGGMEGHAVLALIDENGYPTASTLTIAKADGINWLTFCTSPDSNKIKRILKNGQASVCLGTREYNITLVGTVEVVTDAKTKKDNWLEPMNDGAHWSGPDDPNFCVIKFSTQRYNLYFASDDSAAVGELVTATKNTSLQVTPGLGFKGQCNQAIELYQKAFGAQIVEKINYSQADPKDFKCKPEEKDYIFYSEMAIGNHIISLGDDSDGGLGKMGKTSDMSLLIEFDTVEKLNAAYTVIAEGATIITPMTSSTYCTGYVSLVDKFGIHWDLMSGYKG